MSILQKQEGIPYWVLNQTNDRRDNNSYFLERTKIYFTNLKQILNPYFGYAQIEISMVLMEETVNLFQTWLKSGTIFQQLFKNIMLMDLGWFNMVIGENIEQIYESLKVIMKLLEKQNLILKFLFQQLSVSWMAYYLDQQLILEEL